MATWPLYAQQTIEPLDVTQVGQTTAWNGINFEIIDGPPISGGAPIVLKKYRGWSTVNAQYVYWVEPTVTPAGVNPDTITVVGTVNS